MISTDWMRLAVVLLMAAFLWLLITGLGMAATMPCDEEGESDA